MKTPILETERLILRPLTLADDFGKDVLGVRKFTSHHAEENPNSGKVMMKVGFHYVCDDGFTKMDGTRYVRKRYELEV